MGDQDIQPLRYLRPQNGQRLPIDLKSRATVVRCVGRSEYLQPLDFYLLVL